MTDQEKIAYLEQALREKDHELMRARQEFSSQIAANDLGDASLRHRIALTEQEPIGGFDVIQCFLISYLV